MLPVSVSVRHLVLLGSLLVACGGHGNSADPADPKPAEECTAYADALRVCLVATGASTRVADDVAKNALVPRDEADRTVMNASCALDRARLRSSCQ